MGKKNMRRKTLLTIVCLFCNNFLYGMDEVPIAMETGKFRNEILILLTRPYRDDSALKTIASLLDKGVDPNFKFSKTQKTPLMLAVSHNDTDLMKLLLDRNANVALCDRQNKPTRDFNIIYDEQKIGSLITYAVDYMLLIETHNALHRDEAITPEDAEFFNAEAKELRTALMIDKFFEDQGVKSLVDSDKHPIVKMLCKSPKGVRATQIKRMMRSVFNNDADAIGKGASKEIVELLCACEENK